MRTIGVRELKASLGATLREVAEGNRVRVTSHGRPVADIVPAGSAAADERLSALVAQGRVTPPAAPRPRRAPRLAHARGPASALVIAERDDER